MTHTHTHTFAHTFTHIYITGGDSGQGSGCEPCCGSSPCGRYSSWICTCMRWRVQIHTHLDARFSEREREREREREQEMKDVSTDLHKVVKYEPF